MCIRRKSQTKEIKPELVFLRQKFIASRAPGSLLFISGESHRLRIKKRKKSTWGSKGAAGAHMNNLCVGFLLPSARAALSFCASSKMEL
jgi:hypothetical protein